MSFDTQSPSKSPQRQNILAITKKDDMKAIFRNQVDRQTLGEVQQLNKISQSKYKQIKENYEQQLPNFKKIRKDLDTIHKSIVKVLVCEERIGQIRKQREEERLEQQLINANQENSIKAQQIEEGAKLEGQDIKAMDNNLDSNVENQGDQKESNIGIQQVEEQQSDSNIEQNSINQKNNNKNTSDEQQNNL